MTDGTSSEVKESVRGAIKKGEIAAQHEKSGESWSATWDSPFWDYEKSFKEVFPQRFNEFLDERRKVKKVYALDLMSSPAMVSGLSIDGGLAVGLGDIPTDRYQETMDEKNISYIHGNLLTREPWNKIKDWLRKNDTEGFDLITCRADMTAAHASYVPRNPAVYYSLLDRAWNLLDKNGGVLLVDIPRFIYISGIPKDLVYQWLNMLTEKQVSFKYEEGSAFKLVKKHNSFKHLPNLTFRG